MTWLIWAGNQLLPLWAGRQPGNCDAKTSSQRRAHLAAWTSARALQGAVGTGALVADSLAGVVVAVQPPAAHLAALEGQILAGHLCCLPPTQAAVRRCTPTSQLSQALGHGMFLSSMPSWCSIRLLPPHFETPAAFLVLQCLPSHAVHSCSMTFAGRPCRQMSRACRRNRGEQQALRTSETTRRAGVGVTEARAAMAAGQPVSAQLLAAPLLRCTSASGLLLATVALCGHLHRECSPSRSARPTMATILTELLT